MPREVTGGGGRRSGGVGRLGLASSHHAVVQTRMHLGEKLLCLEKHPGHILPQLWLSFILNAI